MSISLLGIVKATCTTLSNSGSISVPGLKVGDLLIGVWGNGTWIAPGFGTNSSGLEGVVSVDDEIQQSGNNGPYSATLLLLRGF